MSRNEGYYGADWSEEERLLFDEYVKEEMRKLESEVVQEFEQATGASYSGSPAKAESYKKILGNNGASKVVASQSEWNEVQKKLQDNDGRYDAGISVGMAKAAGNFPRSNGNDTAAMLGQNSGAMDKASKQREYARQLQLDQQATAARRQGELDSNQGPVRNNSRIERIDSGGRYDRNDSRNSYSGGYPGVSPRGESGYNKSSLGNASRNIFSGGNNDGASEAELKRLKQKKYFDELNAAASAAPIPADRQPMRRPPVPSSDGVGLNVGSYDRDQDNKAYKQKQYALEIMEASMQAPIAAEHVRRNRAKAEVGGGSASYGGADPNSPAVHIRKPRQDFDEATSQREIAYQRQQPRADFPAHGNPDTQNRRLKQLEYARQLEEDSKQGPIISPRAAIPRRPRSPEADSSSLNPRSPSSVFARGLSGSGTTTSNSQRRTQQQMYAEALDRDRNAKAVMSRENLISPIGAPGLGLGFGVNEPKQDVLREKQRQYMDQLDRDKGSASITGGRAPMVRVVSPNSGTSRLIPDKYGKYSNQDEKVYKESLVEQQYEVGHPPDPMERFERNPHQDVDPRRVEAPQPGYYEDEAELRYQRFAEKMRQEARTKEELAYPRQEGRPISGRSVSNPAARARGYNRDSLFDQPNINSISNNQGNSYYDGQPSGSIARPEYSRAQPAEQSQIGNTRAQARDQQLYSNNIFPTSNPTGDVRAASGGRGGRFRGQSSGGGSSSFSIGGY